MTAKQRMSNSRREGEFAAERLYAELALPSGEPVDIFRVIEDREVWLFFQELKNVLGVYLAGSTPGILINSSRPIGVQRLTAAHELGHHILGHRGGVDDPISLRAAPGRQGEAPRLTLEAYLREISAQAFAMSFLSPALLVRDTMASLDISRDRVPSPEDVYELSLHLGMSYEATAYRLIALREIGVHDLEKVLIEPAKAKQNIGNGLRPENTRADVWPIRETTSNKLIRARVGDELAIALEEIPSSGYRWRLEAETDAFTLRQDTFAPNERLDDEALAGAIGQRRMTLRLTKPGENRVRLDCVRAWRPAPVLRHLSVLVDTEEPPGKSFAIRRSASRAFIGASS